MPLTRISLRAGKPPAYREALMKGVYAAMLESFGVPQDDYFALVHEHDEAGFGYDPGYLGIARDDDLVIIQVTANEGRDTAMKKAFYATVVRNLTENPGLRPENILINLIEVSRENWSFGNGLMQYGPPDT